MNRDNITLPKEVVKTALEAMEGIRPFIRGVSKKLDAAIPALRAALAEQQNKAPAWWRDGLAATLMREGANKHRAKEIAAGYWLAYCQIPEPKPSEDIEALRRENERLREENKQLRDAIMELMQAEASPGGARGGFIKHPASREHEARVQKAWMSLKAALRQEDNK